MKLYKGMRLLKRKFVPFLTTVITRLYFRLNGVASENIYSYGIPFVHISTSGIVKIGKRFTMNNTLASCESGLKGCCRIEVRKGAFFSVGDNVGISATTITCFKEIILKDNVKCGVGVHIYDTDFHALDAVLRRDKRTDYKYKVDKSVIIGSDVFIGAHSIILKGVEIGDNSIIGASSVVTKNVPRNQIWAGNPARFVKNIE